MLRIAVDAPGVTIINTASNAVEKTIPFDRCPTSIAPLPDSSKVYVTDWTVTWYRGKD